MPLMQISGKALNCNLIPDAGANPGGAGREFSRQPLRIRTCGLCFRGITPSLRDPIAAQDGPPYSVNSELTDSSLEIRVIVSARS
jgi:hypothetical protein